MEYYSAIKRSEALTHATTWMNLENVTLSERNETQKGTYCVIPLLQSVQNRQIQRDRKEMSGCQGLGGVGSGRKRGGSLLVGTGVLFDV